LGHRGATGGLWGADDCLAGYSAVWSSATATSSGLELVLGERGRVGTVVVLEIDGRATSHASNLVTTGVVVLRCTAREIRDRSSLIAASLRAVGVGRSSA
jgi:hypothetical protein